LRPILIAPHCGSSATHVPRIAGVRCCRLCLIVNRPGEDLSAIVARACINVGLSPQAIDRLEVEVFDHAPVKAAPSVLEIRNALPKDNRYRNKPLRHLRLTFPRPICGPLILGAGRFRGLGLCLPLGDPV